MPERSIEPLFYSFTDPISGRPCALVVPPDGRVFPEPGEPKIGVAHPDCDTLADLSIELDCFYCQACRWNGRVSGAWCVDMIEGRGDFDPVPIDVTDIVDRVYGADMSWPEDTGYVE